MNAFVTRGNASISHYFEDDSDCTVQPEPTAGGLFARIGTVVRWLADLPRRHAALDELNSLSEHELADIGLTRADLPRLFDPEFVAERNRDRGFSNRAAI
jgi:uncharacterized protein YjiS (DUF1127 family)